MRKRRNVAGTVGAILASLLAVGIICSGCGGDSSKTKTGLGQYSEYELFQAVPAMPKKKVSYTQATHVGEGDYYITASDIELSEYRDYLSTLEKDGFSKVLDNGENGIDGFVYTAHYRKDDLLVIVSYISNFKKVTVTATENVALSEHLFYDPSYVAGNKPGAKTTFSMVELESGGNSFVLQMKDGHFLMFDGGEPKDLPRLIDYLESLTPEGEKPVIDAWFVSHMHPDHYGAFRTLKEEPAYAERIYVESVIFDVPSDELIARGARGEAPGSQRPQILYVLASTDFLHSTDGSGPVVYQPRLGERYYFSDFTIDIIYTLELDEPENWDTTNATSTVMMLTIEGQKVLLTADSDWDSQLIYTDMYDPDYFTLDVYQAPHHGINVYKQITNRLGSIGTVLYPTQAIGTRFVPWSFIGRKVQNEHLVSCAQEALCYGEGTVVLTFPYTVGTAVTLPSKLGND